MPRRLILIATLLLLCTVLASGCSGGHGPAQSKDSAVSAFKLSILDDSFTAGGSAASFDIQQKNAGQDLLLEVHATGAKTLKALYFTLAYDPVQYSPLGVESSGAIAEQDARLDLTLSGQPGALQHGEICALPQQHKPDGTQKGFSGDGVLATVRFARHSFSAVRSVSTPPRTNGSKGPLHYDGPSTTLSWPYYFEGDYNQDFRVSVQDLTPIGLHFGTSVPVGQPDSIEAVVDGNKDGLISVQDLTPIGVNFGAQVDGYNIYEAADTSAYPASNSAASSLLPKAVAPRSGGGAFNITGTPSGGRLQLSRDIAAEGPTPGALYWLRPYDADGEGTPSQDSNGGGGVGNQAPVITDKLYYPVGVASGGVAGIVVHYSDPDGPGISGSVTASDSSLIVQQNVPFANELDFLLSAPVVAVDTVITLTITISDGSLAAQTTLDVTVLAPAGGNSAPQINSATMTPDPLTVGNVGTLDCNATDADSDPLTIFWTHDGLNGSIASSGPSVAFNSSSATQATSATVTAHVDDGHGHQVSQDVTFQLAQPLNSPPLFGSATASPPSPASGGVCFLEFSSTDADGDQISYTITPDIGTVEPGPALNQWYFKPGSVGVDTLANLHVVLDDGNGGSSNVDVPINVVAPLGGNSAPLINAINASNDPIAWSGTTDFSVDFSDADSDVPYVIWQDTTPGGPFGTLNLFVGFPAQYTAQPFTADQSMQLTCCVDDAHGHAVVQTKNVTIKGNAAPLLSGIMITDPLLSGTTAVATPVVTDPEGDTLTYQWSCTDGFFDDSSLASPTYTAPTTTIDEPVTITLEVDDGHFNLAMVDRMITITGVP